MTLLDALALAAKSGGKVYESFVAHVPITFVAVAADGSYVKTSHLASEPFVPSDAELAATNWAVTEP